MCNQRLALQQPSEPNCNCSHPYMYSKSVILLTANGHAAEQDTVCSVMGLVMNYNRLRKGVELLKAGLLHPFHYGNAAASR